VSRIISRIRTKYIANSELDKDYINERLQKAESALTTGKDTNAFIPSGKDLVITSRLENSLDQILSYVSDKYNGADLSIYISALKDLPNKESDSDEARSLRRNISKEFYTLYSLVFLAALSDDAPSPVILMFLNFGYIDEDLAGIDNAIKLYKLSVSMQDHTDVGFYTLFDWLKTVYRGKKSPSRDEFETDFADMLHKERISHIITEKEEAKRLADPVERVNYELTKMFPNVNKMTYGRISTFCPIFLKENCFKDLEDALVTFGKINAIINRLKEVDPTLFYRAGVDMEHGGLLGHLPIHREYLPDIILMPITGSHGVMWQEIEGRKRQSHGRIMLPILFMDSLDTAFIRLAGEFRWELCKRIQGSRWNDVSDKSLTSEYCDYAQYYRKNRDLSSEAKEKIKTLLQRSKNSYKEMFLHDYSTWLTYESTGSPRLNKVVRQILYTYCPFPKRIDMLLNSNPIYAELINRKNVEAEQHLHLVDNLVKKISNTEYPVPQCLLDEYTYYEAGDRPSFPS
ncbi:MAG: hypothetical protein K6F84_03915, partial [Lachnospiraceae bacterium]|nr:hypothetical protein [Lachnospiraceae bacterium]